MPKPAGSRKWLVFLAVCMLAALSIAAIRWQSILTSLGAFLIDSQPPQRADLILVLGGNFWGPRVLTGAELARLRYAPVALLSGPPYQGSPQGELSIEFLVKKGYSRDLFQVFASDARSTIAEANALRGELARRRVKRVLLVTSAYHSRRATIVFTLLCPGIRFISVPATDAIYSAPGWWNDESSRSLFFSEWSKILGSLLIAYPARLFSLAVAGLSRLPAGGGSPEHASNLGDPLAFGNRLPSCWTLQHGMNWVRDRAGFRRIVNQQYLQAGLCFGQHLNHPLGAVHARIHHQDVHGRRQLPGQRQRLTAI